MNTSNLQGQGKWHQYIPHPVVILFGMLILATIFTHFIPAGEFSRELVDGREKVIPGSYQQVDAKPVGILSMFMALPVGFKTASDIIYIVLASGIMFGFLEKSGAVENAVGAAVKRLGGNKRMLLVVLMTYVFGFLGVFVGYENNIALIPIAAVLSIAIGGDLLLAAGIAVGGVTVGFALSPVNAYTIGTGHKIAELPLFSGAGLRTALCFTGLTILAWYNVRYFKKILSNPAASLVQDINIQGFTLSKPLEDYRLGKKDGIAFSLFIAGMAYMLFAVFKYHWYLNEISAFFCLMALTIGLTTRLPASEFGEVMLNSVGKVAPGAFMVGFATSIKVVLEQGQINDTIAHIFATQLNGLSLYGSAFAMLIGQSAMNFLIPSGSGQALATLPILVPVGEVIGLTRQTVVLIFQLGDGITNLVNPALGGLIAMLGMCRVPFDRWLRYISPLFFYIFLIASIVVMFSVKIKYGPF